MAERKLLRKLTAILATDVVGYSRLMDVPGTLAQMKAHRLERLAMLQDLINSGQRDVNRAAVGTVAAVLFDRRGRQPLQLAGRSPHMQAVHVNFEDADEAASCYGAIVDVRITAAHANSLAGRLVRPVAQGTASQAGWARPSA